MNDFDVQLHDLHRSRERADKGVRRHEIAANEYRRARSDVEAQIKLIAEQKIAAARVVQVSALTVEHRDHAWLDKDGDRWEFHAGKWLCDEGGATDDFAPYTRVEVPEPVVVRTLLDDPQHRTSAWIDKENDRWEWREGKWQWRDADDASESWHASGIIRPDRGEGPFTQVVE